MWSRSCTLAWLVLVVLGLSSVPGRAEDGFHVQAGRPVGTAGSSPLTPRPAEFPPARHGTVAPVLGEPWGQAWEASLLPTDAPLTQSASILKTELARASTLRALGQSRKALSLFSRVMSSPNFAALAATAEGRQATFEWGDLLAGAGARSRAREVLARLLTGSPRESWYERAAERMVDLAVEESQPARTLAELRRVPNTASPGLLGDIAFAEARSAERQGKQAEALRGYAAVGPDSRYWAQATFRTAHIEVDQGHLDAAEGHLCRIASPARTPPPADERGGSAFLEIRDQSRLALGRIAHEQGRFDTASYYYRLVPEDSSALASALYESATSRYEAHDFSGAEQLLTELRRKFRTHAYADEAYLLAAHVALARCHYSSAEAELRAFVQRFGPVREAARRLLQAPAQLAALVEAVRQRQLTQQVGLDNGRTELELRVALARDPEFVELAWRHAQWAASESGGSGLPNAAQTEIETAELGAAQAALERLSLRLSRLLSQAKLAQVEVLLGKKRSLRVEIRALTQGYLPPSMVDSLDIPDPLREDEEFWPDQGESWDDEIVGGDRRP